MSEKSLKNARVVLSFIEKNMDLDLLMRLNPEDLDAIRFIVKDELFQSVELFSNALP